MTTPTITEKAQNKVESLADNAVDSKDSEVRYMAYASRLRTALRASTRYIAYVSTLTTNFFILLSRRTLSPAVLPPSMFFAMTVLLCTSSDKRYRRSFSTSC